MISAVLYTVNVPSVNHNLHIPAEKPKQILHIYCLNGNLHVFGFELEPFSVGFSQI